MEKLSKEFWLAVKKEYSESKGQVFLCHGSKTFKKMWYSELRKQIKDLEKKFIEENNLNFGYKSLSSLLFSKYSGSHFKLKTKFIN